ncbi:TPA: hypothetical protein RZK38_001151 [Campylobacter coli]|nr:hypothetical protein [Campylobacter coli]
MEFHATLKKLIKNVKDFCKITLYKAYKSIDKKEVRGKNRIYGRFVVEELLANNYMI